MGEEVDEPVYKLRMVPVCEACEGGKGGECHTPGCSFWMSDAPTEPLQYFGEPLLGEDDPYHQR
jgi:hypothetical protein